MLKNKESKALAVYERIMLKNIPPKIRITLLYIFITIGYLFRFLLVNIYGIFILSLAVYFNTKLLFNVEPYSFSELVDWLVSLSEAAKIAILSSSIPIIGFFIAYATATANWKSQIRENLKIQAAGEIEVFFTECSRSATNCKIYAEGLVQASKKIRNNCTKDEGIFLAHYHREQSLIFKQDRDRLATLNVEVHRISGKYGNLFLSLPGLKSTLDEAIEALEKISKASWIKIPFHINNDLSPVLTFTNQFDVEECRNLIKVVNTNYNSISSSSGNVQGRLMSSVLDVNLWFLLSLFRDRKVVLENFERKSENLNKLNN